MFAISKRALLSAVVCWCAATATASADVITDWNEKAIGVVMAKPLPPWLGERVMAQVHVAMFDAVNSIERRYQPYLVQLPADPTASAEAAAASAAGAVLMVLHPEAEGEMRAALDTYLAKVPDGDAKSQGTALGQAVAAKVLEARRNDGASMPEAYRPKTKPGVYIPTPMAPAAMWPNVKPFAMQSGAQFRPPPPIALTSEQWATDYNEIKALGAKNSTQRSARQTEDARFWLATGQNVYYPVIRSLAVAKELNVIDCARLFALVAVARSDSLVAVFDAKFHYEFWRPITAIRNGDIDDNPATERDAAWQPIADTPMHPEYPCAHCIVSGAMAGVVEAEYGTADVPDVSTTSPTAPGVTHHWTNMRAFADEVAQARIWAGFHYRFSTRVGQDMGLKIGDYVVRNVMQPAISANLR
jgi:PAP2 superfamily